MQETGLMERNMDREPMCGLMEDSMLVLTRMIRNMDLECTSGQMGKSMLESG